MGDAEALAADLREADRAEITAAARGSPLDIIRQGLAISPLAAAVVRPDGHLLALCGIGAATLTSRVGVPWMLGTNLLTASPRSLIEHGPAYVSEALHHYPTLVNFVDARNRASLAYLRRLGFVIDDPEPFGWKGLPFHRFHMARSA